MVTAFSTNSLISGLLHLAWGRHTMSAPPVLPGSAEEAVWPEESRLQPQTRRQQDDQDINRPAIRTCEAHTQRRGYGSTVDPQR